MALRIKSNPLVFLFSRSWGYGGDRRIVALYWVLFVCGTAVGLFGNALIWANIMNTVQLHGITTASAPKLGLLLALSFCVELGFWLFHGPARLMERTNAFTARLNYRRHLLLGVMTLPLDWHADHHSGDTIDKVEKGTTGLHQFADNSFLIIQGLVQIVGSCAVLCYFCPPAAIVLACMISVAVWVTVRFDRVIVKNYRELNLAENRVTESVFDAISNITTVIILRVERLVFSAVMHKAEQPFDLYKRTNRLIELKWFLTSLCCSGNAVLVLGLYFYLHTNAAQAVLVGDIYLLVRYLYEVSECFYRFTTMYGDVLQRRARVANSEELSVDFRPENFANHVLPANWRELSIKDLSFSYNSGESRLHLDNVTLSLKRGERVAFVGETGSGKTTMLKVVRDLHHPQSLQLSVDGVGIPHGFEGISRAIALIPQDPEIFATTILENITLGAEYEPRFVHRFAEMACVADVVAELPHGYDSSIKEKGVNLSGGQKQRLALSRGLLACHDKTIVLLDEPTSSLDAMTEMRVYRNIFSGFQGKTIVSSIHRLHLLPLFDRVCMFEDGKIIASGTLDELLASCPAFAALWEAMRGATS